MGPGEQPLSLVGFLNFQLGNFFADRTGEAQCCTGGLTLAVKSSFHRRATAFLVLIRLSGGNIAEKHGQAAGTGVRAAACGLETDLVLFQAGAHCAEKSIPDVIQCLGRQLFTPQLDQ